MFETDPTCGQLGSDARSPVIVRSRRPEQTWFAAKARRVESVEFLRWADRWLHVWVDEGSALAATGIPPGPSLDLVWWDERRMRLRAAPALYPPVDFLRNGAVEFRTLRKIQSQFPPRTPASRTLPPSESRLWDDHPQRSAPGLRHQLWPILGFSGWREAADGEEAIRCVRELRPDIAVVDLDLPKRDGLGAARELQRMGIQPGRHTDHAPAGEPLMKRWISE